MSDSHEKGRFEADIPADAVEEALRAVDRRGGGSGGNGDGGGDGDGGDPGEGGGPMSEVEKLRAELELSQTLSRESQKKLEDLHDRWLRAVADLENYKKRAQKEREEVQKFGAERLLKDLLPVLDNLDRALAAAPPDAPLTEGVRLVRQTFEAALARHGVKAFSAMGEPFDPARHEALMQVPTADAAPGTVVMEHARGFLLHERLVRPAMVGVAVAVAAPPAEDGGGNG